MSRKSNRPDSFGLLIDTMCNAIGGLVLIAVLVAIIGSTSNPSNEEIERLSEQILIETNRQYNLAAEYERLQRQLVNFTGATDDTKLLDPVELASLDSQMREKESIVDDTKEQLEAVEVQTQNIKTTDPATLISEHRDQLRKIEIQNIRLQAEVDELTNELSQLKQVTIREIQLPRERRHPRIDFLIIYQGYLYPLYDEEVFNPPKNYFEVVHKTGTTISFRPKAGGGISFHSTAFQNYLTSLERSGAVCYLLFYPDSHGYFEILLEFLRERGINHGVGFPTIDGLVSFTTGAGVEVRGM